MFAENPGVGYCGSPNRKGRSPQMSVTPNDTSREKTPIRDKMDPSSAAGPSSSGRTSTPPDSSSESPAVTGGKLQFSSRLGWMRPKQQQRTNKRGKEVCVGGGTWPLEQRTAQHKPNAEDTKWDKRTKNQHTQFHKTEEKQVSIVDQTIWTPDNKW